jgi:hypothetical protein
VMVQIMALARRPWEGLRPAPTPLTPIPEAMYCADRRRRSAGRRSLVDEGNPSIRGVKHFGGDSGQSGAKEFRSAKGGA